MNNDNDLWGGYRLMPTPAYLATLETFEEHREAYRDAVTVPELLRRQRIELNDIYRKMRRLEMQIERARKHARAHAARTSPWPSEEAERARDAEERLCDEHAELSEEAEELEADFKRLVFRLEQGFVAVRVDRDAIDTRFPDRTAAMRREGMAAGSR